VSAVNIICELESDPATAASEISNDIIGIEEDFERFARMTINDGEFDQFACSDEERKVCEFVQYVAGTRVDNQDFNLIVTGAATGACLTVYMVDISAFPLQPQPVAWKGKVTKYGQKYPS